MTLFWWIFNFCVPTEQHIIMARGRRRYWNLIDLILDGFVGVSDVFVARFMCAGGIEEFVRGFIWIWDGFFSLIVVIGLLKVVWLLWGPDKLDVFCGRAFRLNFIWCIPGNAFVSCIIVEVVVFTDSLWHCWDHKIAGWGACYSLIDDWGHIDWLVLRLNDGSIIKLKSTSELRYFFLVPWNKGAFVPLEHCELIFIKVHDVVLVFNFDVVHLFVFWQFLNFSVFYIQCLFESCHLVFKGRDSDLEEFYLILLVFRWGFGLGQGTVALLGLNLL